MHGAWLCCFFFFAARMVCNVDYVHMTIVGRRTARRTYVRGATQGDTQGQVLGSSIVFTLWKSAFCEKRGEVHSKFIIDALCTPPAVGSLPPL